MTIRQVKISDDLSSICAQMQPSNWDKANDMSSYQPEALKKFLEAGGVLLLAYDGATIAGAALCYVLPHPSGDDTFYVHELDTHPSYRRQGVAKQLMQKAMALAKEQGLDEVWLGADQDNPPANHLYKSLLPTEIEPTTTYSYKVK
jgi:diamine N-acetyltransferase